MGKPDKKKIAEMVVLNDLGKSTRQIGAQTGHSPQTVAKYLRSSELDDPKVKELVANMREHETDNLMLLGGKAQARLHQKLDANKLKPIELIALMDRSFQQRRLLEGNSTANIGLKGILKIQQEALGMTMEVLSGKTEQEVLAGKTKNNAPQRPGRPHANRKPATNP